MPPRNSNTKTYKVYERYSNPGSHPIPLDKIYASILNPEEALGNKFSKKFEEYKKKSEDKGIDLEVEIQKNLKDDMDGDDRYVMKEWYIKKLRG